MFARICILTLAFGTTNVFAAEPCQTFHGRAHLSGGDGQLRIWHIGTHHEFQPDPTTWSKVTTWLETGVTDADKRYASPASMVYLYGDFVVCPVEPIKVGAVQTAIIGSVQHRRYVDAQ